MKTTKKKSKMTVAVFLTISLFFYTVLFLAIILSLVGVMYIRLSKINDDTSYLQLENYKTEITNLEFDSINYKKAIGLNNYVKVYDEDGKMEYTNNRTNDETEHSLDQLQLIPDYKSSYYPQVTTYEESGNQYTQIIYFEDSIEQIVSNLIVINSSGNIVSSLKPTTKTNYSNEDLKLIQNSSNSTYYLYRYEFKDINNEQHYMIVYKNVNFDEISGNAYYTIFTQTIIAISVLYIGQVIFFIFFLNRKVKDPLKKLDASINKVKDGDHTQSISYHGPLEFENICNNFNDLNSKLELSEIKNRENEENKRTIISNISHDLKTPITIIQGYASALNDKVISEKDQRLYLDLILDKSNYLVSMINLLAEYNKMEHPQFTLQCESVDIGIFMQNYVAEKYNELKIIGYDCQAKIVEESHHCNLDTFQFKRAIDNLISNSVRHNEKGTSIYILVSYNENTAHISIADNGVGIARSLQSKIFEPFIMGDKSRNKEGSGLGLSITKVIIEKHGGTIELKKHSDYSVEFLVTLPLEK